MNVKRRIYNHRTMQVLGTSITKERGGYDRRNIANQDARRTTKPNADAASRTPGREEVRLGYSGRTAFRRKQCYMLESRREASMETPETVA
jgi:hypothetical protein